VRHFCSSLRIMMTSRRGQHTSAGAAFLVKGGIKTFEPRGRFTLKRDSMPECLRQ
jgi:hypothetical protein